LEIIFKKIFLDNETVNVLFIKEMFFFEGVRGMINYKTNDSTTAGSPVAQYEYTAIFEPAEEGGYIVHVPVLNGLTTEAETLEDAKEMVKDAIKGYLEALKIQKLPIPEEKHENKPHVELVSVSA